MSKDKVENYVECGCCGMYHRSNFHGDCHNNNERLTIDQIPSNATILTVEEQMEKEGTE